ncbi:hypothetical protein J6590_074322 [Homalodisca vitripennis]|nr:hypothetical protein J6590_091771 [Homalodisca vitripennis]KAG8335197.1 hypothetical protein J6590_074322 [Homalodisca vitripennis]
MRHEIVGKLSKYRFQRVLPGLYILDVALYCRLKYTFERGRNVHQYGTRGEQHRTAAFKHFPCWNLDKLDIDPQEWNRGQRNRVEVKERNC